MELSTRQRRALEEICDDVLPVRPRHAPTRHAARGRRGARGRGPQPARIRASPVRCPAVAVGQPGAGGARRRRLQALRRSAAGSAGAGTPLLGRLPPAAAARRVPGAAQGGAALLLHAPRAGRRAQPGVGRDRLRRAARQARERAGQGPRADSDRARHAPGLRCRDRRLGRRRRCRGGGARGGRPRRGRDRVGGLLRR